MATLQIDVQSQNRARRELLDLRQQMQDINVQLTQNASRYQKADGAQREKLRTDRAELTLSRRRLQNSASQIRIYQAETREVERLAREKQKLNRTSQFLSRTFRDLRFHIAGIVTSQVLFGLSDFTSSIVRIGAETETARATLRQFTDDVDGTFARLESISQQLTGIDLPDIISTFTQLRAASAEAADAEVIVTGFTKSLNELGRTRFDIQRFFGQLRQSFAANRIEGDDFKTLIEIFPNIIARSNRVLGSNIDSWKDLQGAIDAANLTVREFYIRLAQQQELESAGADVNTFRVQTELLREEWQGFIRDISERILPSLTELIKTVREGFGAPTETLDIAIPLPELNSSQTQQLRLINIQESRKRLNEEILALEERTGTSLDNIIDASLEISTQLKEQRDALNSGIASRGIAERIRTSLNEQVTIRNAARELQAQQTELAEREADAQQRITQSITQRPRATGDFGLTQPFGTFSPQTTVGPLLLPQPDQEFGGLGRRPVYRRPLSEVGPQDIARIPAPLLGSAGARPVIRPTFPITPPTPDLSGAGRIDTGAILEDINTYIRGQHLPAQPSDIAAFIPVDQFEQALVDIETNFQEEQRLQREIIQGRQAFARDLERDVASRERVTGGLLQTGVDTAFGLANIPQDLLGISRSGADQRVDAAARATAEIEAIELNAQRRIEDIQNNRIISERERADQILQITQDLAERKTDIEAAHAARIAQIEERTANQRRNYYFEFAQSAINDINRVIQRELILRLVRDLSTALPGGLGTGILAVASLGLTAASTGLSAAQSGRSQSLAREQQSRFEGAARSDANFEVTIRNDDGSIRKQNASGRRVYNEGRSAR